MTPEPWEVAVPGWPVATVSNVVLAALLWAWRMIQRTPQPKEEHDADEQ